MSSGYERRWDYTSENGDQGELFARWAANGLRSGASLEIKNDRESWATGNVYIEYQCLVSGQWMPSGIDARHTEAEIWAHVIVGPIVIFAPTEYVRWVAEKEGEFKELTEGRNPTRGYVIAIPRFVAALVGTAKRWARDDGLPPLRPVPADPAAPFGRDAKGLPVAPYGYTKDREVRLNPGGKRACEPVPPALWGEPGASRADNYDPAWLGDLCPGFASMTSSPFTAR
jgi:hypothetical protein